MSAELIKHQPQAPAHYDPNTLSAQMDYARALAESNLLPKQYFKQPANLLWAISYGQTLGVAPLTAVQSIHVINGKPTASADLIAGLVRRAGHKLRVNGDDRKAVAQIIRADDPGFTFEVVWTIERAQAAKLTGKDTWKNFPAAMLKARAITEVARAACSEILQGTIYTPEELGANVDADGIPIEAPVQQLRRVQPGEQDPWAAPPPQPKGTLVVDPECIVTHPEGQAVVDAAAQATHRGEVKERWAEAKDAELLHAVIKAPDTGEWEMVREYLTRLGKALPGAAPAAPAEDDVTDVEVVAEGETEADIAERDLRAAAEKVGLTELDAEFERSYGLPIAQAGAQQLREMTSLLTGSAA